MDADATGVTVTATVNNTTDVDPPEFAICASPNNNVCTISDLPTGPAQELLVGSAVEADAVAGDTVTLTAAVTSTTAGATSFTANATVTIASESSADSSSDDFSSDSALGDIPDLPSFDIPGSTTPGQGPNTYTTPTNPAGLFPAVSPKHHKKGANIKATTDSAIMPLGSRLVDGQVAGLVVLASAIVIAVVRLSLRRRPRDSGGPQQGQNATPSA
jgi:hypothetical protein